MLLVMRAHIPEVIEDVLKYDIVRLQRLGGIRRAFVVPIAFNQFREVHR